MKVSVIIPFYNRNELLRCSISSALSQTLPPHEIIVVDDCSPEDTRWLAVEFPSVHVLRLPQNKGPGGGRYQGALAATGTHIATLDMDDYWYPEKLEKQIAFANTIGDPQGLYSHLQWVEETGGGTIRPQDIPQAGEPISEYLFVRNGLLQSNTFLMERNCYLKLCRISDDLFADDWEIVLRAEENKFSIYVQKEVLSHWNCISDPGRGSQSHKEDYYHNFLVRHGPLFTLKARSAFLARNLVPCLAEQGQVFTPLRLLGHALLHRALTPVAVLKVALRCLFPQTYKRGAAWYGHLRHRHTDSAQEKKSS